MFDFLERAAQSRRPNEEETMVRGGFKTQFETVSQYLEVQLRSGDTDNESLILDDGALQREFNMMKPVDVELPGYADPVSVSVGRDHTGMVAVQIQEKGVQNPYSECYTLDKNGGVTFVRLGSKMMDLDLVDKVTRIGTLSQVLTNLTQSPTLA